MKILDTDLGPFWVYDEGTITRALEAGQWWDDHLKPILDEVESGVAIDIGAHFGWFTIYLAQRLARVIAVEPYPSSFERLIYNVQRRPGLEHRIQCWPVAACDQVTVLALDPANDQTDAGSFGFTLPQPGSGIRVPAVPLDQYLPAHTWLRLHDISLIKCDAQGADLRALEGLALTIQRCRPLIVFEWEADMAGWQGDDWTDYMEFFDRIGYRVERITPDYWDFVARPQ